MPTEKILITLAIIAGVIVYNRWLAGRTFTLSVRLWLTPQLMVALAFGVACVIVAAGLLARGGM
jgi:hypothetical protein